MYSYTVINFEDKSLAHNLWTVQNLIPLDIRLLPFVLLLLAIYSSILGAGSWNVCGGGLLLQQSILLLWLPYTLWHIWLLRRRVTVACCCQHRYNLALNRAIIRMRIRLAIASIVAIGMTLGGGYACGHSMVLQMSICWLLALCSIGIFALELGFIYWMLSQLKMECWVTVVDDVGKPVAIVPSSRLIEVTSGRLSLVRLLVVSNNLIYLERCRITEKQQYPYYDTPLVTWQRAETSTLESAQEMIDARFCGVRRVYPREVLRYHSQRDQNQLYNHLYTVYIHEPNQLQIDCKPMEGKWWCWSQLREQMRLCPQEFSPALHEELPFLDHTVMFAQKIH